MFVERKVNSCPRLTILSRTLHHDVQEHWIIKATNYFIKTILFGDLLKIRGKQIRRREFLYDFNLSLSIVSFTELNVI